MTLFTVEGGNLDCFHPVQSVLDALCMDRKNHYADLLNEWFKGYSEWRKISGIWKPYEEAAVLWQTKKVKSVNQVLVSLVMSTAC